jgi:hypothetical protein
MASHPMPQVARKKRAYGGRIWKVNCTVISEVNSPLLSLSMGIKYRHLE